MRVHALDIKVTACWHILSFHNPLGYKSAATRGHLDKFGRLLLDSRDASRWHQSYFIWQKYYWHFVGFIP